MTEIQVDQQHQQEMDAPSYALWGLGLLVIMVICIWLVEEWKR